jgi:hypothetical protein
VRGIRGFLEEYPTKVGIVVSCWPFRVACVPTPPLPTPLGRPFLQLKLMDMPEEVLVRIFSELKIRPLVKLARVSRACRRFAYSDPLWLPAVRNVFGEDLAVQQVPALPALACSASIATAASAPQAPTTAPQDGLIGRWRATFITCYKLCQQPQWRLTDLLRRLGKLEKVDMVKMVLDHVQTKAKHLMVEAPGDPAYVCFDQVGMKDGWWKMDARRREAAEDERDKAGGKGDGKRVGGKARKGSRKGRRVGRRFSSCPCTASSGRSRSTCTSSRSSRSSRVSVGVSL